MRICILGDSITWGASDMDKGGWVERLKMYIGEKYETEVYNLGVSGDTTDHLLRRIEIECKTRGPNIVVLAIGINDSQYVRSKKERRVPLERFQKNVRKLYEIARIFSEKVVFVGLTNVDESKTKSILWNADKEYDNEGIREYDKIIKDFSTENSLKFIGMNDVLEQDDLEDGLHPNSRGHERMFEKIKLEIEMLLNA